jgi:hypothetical protein
MVPGAQEAELLQHVRHKNLSMRAGVDSKTPHGECNQLRAESVQAMTTFLDDAAMPLDNNISEREIKRVVMNRKNRLLVGNERGGRAAVIQSVHRRT